MKYFFIFAVIASGALAIISTFSPAFSDDAKAQATTAPTPAPTDVVPQGKSQRSKNLSFDDSVVEGLNQNNKDSLEMVEKRDGRNRQHLYQKRADFKPEIKQFPSEMGYSP